MIGIPLDTALLHAVGLLIPALSGLLTVASLGALAIAVREAAPVPSPRRRRTLYQPARAV